MRITGLLAALLLMSGCALFRPAAGKPEEISLYAVRIVGPCAERRLERRELILAIHESLESSREVSILRPVLQKQQIGLKIIRIEDRDALSAMVRSGRADVMAGAFSLQDIRSLHLLPVLPYTGTDGRSQFCFAVRYGDQILEKLLGPAASSVKNGERNQK